MDDVAIDNISNLSASHDKCYPLQYFSPGVCTKNSKMYPNDPSYLSSELIWSSEPEVVNPNPAA